MGLIILFAVMAIIVAFLSGIAVAGADSHDNDNPIFTSVIAIFYLVVSISISIGMTYIYILRTKNIHQLNTILKRKSLLLRKIIQLNWILFTHLHTNRSNYDYRRESKRIRI